MPNSGYFQIPFIPQEGINQQILQSLAQAFQEHQARQEMGLKQRAQDMEQTRNNLLNQYTQLQIASEKRKNQFDTETDPLRKQKLADEMTTTAYQKSELENHLKQFGVDTEAIKSGLPTVGGTSTALPAPFTPTAPAPTAAPVQTPFQKQIGVSRALLEKKNPFTPDEEAIWGNAVSQAQSSMDSKPITAAMQEIVNKRVEMQKHDESLQATQAQRDIANEMRRQTFTLQQNAADERTRAAEEKRTQKGQAPVYALNAETNQREQVTQADVDANPKKYTNPVSVKESDINRDTAITKQLNDVQMNTSRYRKALGAMTAEAPLSATDSTAISKLIQNDKFRLQFLGSEIPVDWISKLWDNPTWSALSPRAQDAVIGYIGSRTSVIAYQKAVSGSGRSNKEQLDLELANIPTPLEPARVQMKKLDRWQENIDAVATGIPKLAGIPNPKEIRKEIESTPTATPAAPFPTAQPGPRAPTNDVMRLLQLIGGKP